VNIDDLKFGNPPKEQEEKVKRDVGGLLKKAKEMGVIDDILRQFPFPKNSSDITENELMYLKKLTDSQDEDDIKFLKLMEEDHYTFFEIVADKLGIDIDKDGILEWIDDIDPIKFYLKDQFNRPRPYQVSDYLGIELNPPITTDANSSSYPSGHTMDFLVIINNLIKLKPEKKSVLNNLYKQIRDVRERSGVHYPSDTRGTELIVQKLIQNKIV
jgi:hypothetical protein